MKKIMFMAALLGFAVSCGSADKSNDEAVEQAQDVEVAAPVVEAVVEQAAPAVEEKKAEEPKVELQAPATIKADEKSDAKMPEMKESGIKVSNMTVVKQESEPKKLEQAGTGAKRLK